MPGCKNPLVLELHISNCCPAVAWPHAGRRGILDPKMDARKSRILSFSRGRKVVGGWQRAWELSGLPTCARPVSSHRFGQLVAGGGLSAMGCTKIRSVVSRAVGRVTPAVGR